MRALRTSAAHGALTGRVAVVTDADAGLGCQLVHGLARHGARVVMCCQNPAAGEELADWFRGAGTDVWPMGVDLSDIEAVPRWGEAILRASGGRVDLLVQHVAPRPAGGSEAGPGRQRYLRTELAGAFALTAALYPTLRTCSGRVVTVCEASYRLGQLDPDIVARGGTAGSFPGRTARARDELVKALLSAELHRRVEASKHPVRVTTAHSTTGADVVACRIRAAVRQAIGRPVDVLTLLQDTSAVLRAAVDPQARSGDLYGSVLVPRERCPRPLATWRCASDPRMGRMVWEWAEQTSKLCFRLD